ncbi:MAG: Rrf2 family transcriptional regulator [Planctomycetota bacterium]|nr:Rrf2 family transcriptional regulator [Planctomycetota bacterium]
MRYSQSTELAIDSLLYMAARPEASDFSVEQVAAAQEVSASYLAKVFQQLVKAGVLRSHRGSKGGYALGRPLSLITLRDIAVVFEGSSPLYECDGYARTCSLGPKCLVKATFDEAERKMHEVLAKVSLQDVVAQAGQEAAWTAAHGCAPLPPPVAVTQADSVGQGGATS